MPNHLLRSLPSIERLLERPVASQLFTTLGRDRVRDLLREITDELRDQLSSAAQSAALSTQSLTEEVELRLNARAAHCALPSLRRVINATGVIIHTNLGRAPLAPEAIERIREVAEGYSNLEYDLAAGGRGSRQEHVTKILRRLTGAEAALVVNNNAAAVMLALAALAE